MGDENRTKTRDFLLESRVVSCCTLSRLIMLSIIVSLVLLCYLLSNGVHYLLPSKSMNSNIVQQPEVILTCCVYKRRDTYDESCFEMCTLYTQILTYYHTNTNVCNDIPDCLGNVRFDKSSSFFVFGTGSSIRARVHGSSTSTWATCSKQCRCFGNMAKFIKTQTLEQSCFRWNSSLPKATNFN